MAPKKEPIVKLAIDLIEGGWMPDFLVRAGIRRLLSRRLRTIRGEYESNPDEYRQRFLDAINRHPVADRTEEANAQHYELPPSFFDCVLGPRRKYSSCLWPRDDMDLAAAEEAMLALTCERAELADGQTILELGCGWGSLTLWMLETLPAARVTAVTNSRLQAETLRDLATAKGVADRLEVLHCDINDLHLDSTFDRIVSVEMFEHVRNYAELFASCAGWLKEDGRMFLHVFAHDQVPYLFTTEGDSDWMGKYFFAGGTMPSQDLFDWAQTSLVVDERWRVNGRHYGRTLNAWLAKMDAHRGEAEAILREHYGSAQAALWRRRWRIFFMACAELFNYRNGDPWGVCHARFRKP